MRRASPRPCRRTRRRAAHHARTAVAVLAALLLAAGSAGAVPSGGAVPSATPSAALRAAGDRAARAIGAPLDLRTRRGTDTASFVRRVDRGDLVTVAPRAAAGDKAEQFVVRYADLFGLRDARSELRRLPAETDALGWTHVAWEQVHGGIEVFGARLRAHVAPDGALRVVNGAAVPIPGALATSPALPADEARRIAVAALRGDAASIAGDRLVVYPTGLIRGVAGEARLAHAVEVVEGSGHRTLVLVDALDGRVLDRLRLTPDALSRRVSQATAGNVVWSEGNPDPIPAGWAGASASRIAGWQDEIDGAREAYNLIGSVSLGTHLGFDGADAIMRAVHDASGLGCPNASWNGTTTNFCSGVTSDDVVAHEWGHAYTQFTSDLVYAWQPGALNESYSDVWGELADRLNGRGTDAPSPPRAANGSACSSFGAYDGSLPATDASWRWLVGEDSSAFGGAIRDMWKPECHFDPGRVSSSRYACGSGDQGGVHTNSGVPNHFFALLVDGGTYNGKTVAALGATRAAAILWRAASVYETQVTDFADHADAVEQSCADLVGQPLGEAVTTGPATWSLSAATISAADCAAVSAAIAAVELRDPPGCPTSPILAASAPPLCDGLGTVETVSLSDFEGTLAPWTAGTRAVAKPSTYDGGTWSRVGSLPDGRPGAAAFTADPITGDCVADDESGVSYLESPPFVVPADRPVLRIAFDHWIATEPSYDGGNVKVSVNGGPFAVVPAARFGFNKYNGTLAVSSNTCPMAGEPAWTGSNGGSLDGSWGQSQLDLSGFAAPGDAVRLRFELGMDGCNGNRGWYVDDVRVYTCAGEVPPGSLCPATPLAGCKTAGKSTLMLRDDAVDTRDRFTWTWTRGGATSLGDLGNPLGPTAYAVCIWDGRGGSPALVATAEVAGGTGWKATGASGFRYSDRFASAGGVNQIKIRTGVAGKATLNVQAKGPGFDVPPAASATRRFEASPSLVVQLVSGLGTCWQSSFATTDFRRNTPPLARATRTGP